MINKNDLANFDAMLFDLVKWIKDTRNKITVIVRDGFSPFYRDAKITVIYPVLGNILLGANECCTDIRNAFTKKFSDCLRNFETPEISHINIDPDWFGSYCPKDDEQCLCIDIESNIADKDDMKIWGWDRIIVPFSELDETTTFEQIFKKYSAMYLKAQKYMKENLRIFSENVKVMSKGNNYISISHNPNDLKEALEEVMTKYCHIYEQEKDNLKEGKNCNNCGNKIDSLCVSGGNCFRGYADGTEDCWKAK